MDFLSPPATPLESSSNAFNASDSVQDLLGVTTNNLGASTIITVNSIADVVDNNDGVTTLREAINFANADTGEDVIVFARSLFSTQQTISLSLGELDITHNLSIIAPRDSLTGGDLLTVSGNNATRVFEIGSGATVTLSGLIVTDGLVTSLDLGGGIKNSGTLTLDNSIVRNNSARYGGGIANSKGAMLTVSNSTISRNSARDGGGGGIYSSDTMLTVSNSTISGNSARDGGGIDSGSAMLTVSNSTISGNSANQSGGGIVGGTMNVSNSTISGNSAQAGGGGIDGSYTTMNVSNSTISGNSARDGGGIDGYTMNVSNSTISGNSAQASGGGIDCSGTMNMSNSTISGNSAQTGGGIFNFGGTEFGDAGNGTDFGGIWTVSNSTISGNSANDRGGGIFNGGTMNVSNSTISGNSATYSISGGDPVGGGIYNYGILKVSNSTLIGNSAANNGGGIYNDRGAAYSKTKSTVEVSNSTLSGNSAGNNGGGIYNYGYIRIGDPNDATVTINNSTLTLNSAADGGGVFNFAPGSVRVRNTIIASNLFSQDGLNPDVAGSFISDGYNLIGDGTDSIGFAATGDIVGTSDNPIDPRLGSLDANGGPTQTHALLESSPAIDAGDPTMLDTDPTTDQRGFPRVSGARVDIGAFEFSLIV